MSSATPAQRPPRRGNLTRMPLGRRGYPKPPAHIWTLMEQAGRDNDPIALGLAHALYEAWLTDQGYRTDHHTGFHQPDKVWND